MRVELSENYILTDEYPESSDAQTVLFDLFMDEAFGAGNIVELYTDWGFEPAALQVKKMLAEGDPEEWTEEERAFIEAFTRISAREAGSVITKCHECDELIRSPFMYCLFHSVICEKCFNKPPQAERNELH